MPELLTHGRSGEPPSHEQITRLPTVSSAAPLGEQLYQILEEAIIKGDFRPGEPLNDKELMAHFGVSRIPYRDAIQALEKAGWIEKIGPRQGMRVRPLGEAELANIVEVRQTLDGECAALAATRHTPEQLDDLARLAREGRAALDGEDREKLASLNSEFHAMIAKCTQNTIFEEILSTLERRVRRFYWAASTQVLKASATEHDKLLKAIRDRDAEAARAIARSHAARHPEPAEAPPQP
jgi:DNA-binding GntR family transcriptional regulator